LNDPSGLWIPQAIGAVVGLTFEGYDQFDVFKHPINKMPAANYGTAGSATGAAVGGGIANQ